MRGETLLFRGDLAVSVTLLWFMHWWSTRQMGDYGNQERENLWKKCSALLCVKVIWPTVWELANELSDKSHYCAIVRSSWGKDLFPPSSLQPTELHFFQPQWLKKNTNWILSDLECSFLQNVSTGLKTRRAELPMISEFTGIWSNHIPHTSFIEAVTKCTIVTMVTWWEHGVKG